MNKTSAGDVLERLQAAYGVNNDSQLSEAAGVNRATVGNWRGRDSVPYSFCVEVSLNRGVSLDWLLTGRGTAVNETPPAYNAPQLTPEEDAVLTLFRSLDEDARREIFSVAQEKERLRRLEQLVSELASTVAEIKNQA